MTTHSSLTNEALNWGESPIISGSPETGHRPSNLRRAVLASRSNLREAKKRAARQPSEGLIATVAKLKIESTYSKQTAYENSNRNKSDLSESIDRIHPLTTNHWTPLTEFLIDRPEIRIVRKPLKTNDNTNSNRPNSREMRESSGARRGREVGPWRAEALWGCEGGSQQILIGPGDD
jgi:hypothetical protein